MDRKLGGLILLSLALAWPPVAAESIAELRLSTCESSAATAKKIMEHRQAGTAMATLMQRTAKVDLPKAERDALRQRMIEAYDSPRFGTEKYQEIAVRDFENDAYLRCLKSMP